MIGNVTKRRENKHTDKPHDWKRGKRRQTRKESASYVSRLFLILKVFWTYSSSPQLSVSHDVPAMLKDVMVLWKHPKQNACFQNLVPNGGWGMLVCDKEPIIFIIVIFVLQCWRAGECDVMGQGIHKIEICLHGDSRHSSSTSAASHPCQCCKKRPNGS